LILSKKIKLRKSKFYAHCQEKRRTQRDTEALLSNDLSSVPRDTSSSDISKYLMKLDTEICCKCNSFLSIYNLTRR